MATATKQGNVSTGGGRPAYVYATDQVSLPRGYKTAKPPKTPRSASALEPPVPPAEKGVILKAIAHGSTYRLVQKADAPQAKVHPKPVPRALSSDPAAKRLEVSKAVAKYTQLRDYLRRVSTGKQPLITPDTAARAMKAWITLWKASGFSMAAPAACTGPDGEMFYSWDRGRHHLELEIIPNAPAEFFYRDRETEQFWGEDFNIGERLPAVVVAKLGVFR